jgi:hypothetical protein
VPAQTWLIGNTVSDILITSALLYHVRTSESVSRFFEADGSLIIPQLAKRRVRDGQYSSHTIIRIVRLTIETNVVTSMYCLVGYVIPANTRSATVSIIALLMVAIFPVRDLLYH